MLTTSDTFAAFYPQDTDVQWFGCSQRLIGGQPDSRYGWLDLPDGPCIVKALSPDLTAYASTLLDHERKMLKRLAAINASVPQLVEVERPDWLVTRFGGLSLQRLEHPSGLQGTPPGPRFGFSERLSAWMHLLRNLQTMADKGMLAIDLYSANVVLPLTQVTHGQLRLMDASMIDHAQTVEAGMAMRRPVWLDHRMKRIAPELQDVMRADMNALRTAFDKAGAALPGYSRLPSERDAHSRRVWAEYDAPQHLQQLLDQGSLSRDRAMQFAVGMSLSHLPELVATQEERQALTTALQRMTAQDASQRYATLTQAANALAGVVNALPLVSQHTYTRLKPQDLAIPLPPIAPDVPPVQRPAEQPFTTLANEANPLAPTTAMPAANAGLAPAPPLAAAKTHLRSAYKLPMRWLFSAVVLGAACGTFWPL
jgi:hypothetical protein